MDVSSAFGESSGYLGSKFVGSVSMSTKSPFVLVSSVVLFSSSSSLPNTESEMSPID